MFTTLLSIALSGHAFGQEFTSGEPPALNAQLFRPSIDSDSTIWTDDSALAPSGSFSTRAVMSWTHSPLVYRVESTGEETAIVGDILQADLMGAYTWRRLRVGVDAPVYLRATSDITGDETALGDIAFDARATVVDGASAPVGFAIGGRVGAPTSTADAPLGDPGGSWELQAIVDKHLGRLHLAANVGTRGAQEAALENIDWANRFVARAGAGYAVTDDVGVSLDLTGQAAYGGWGNPAATPAEAMLGAWVRPGGEGLLLRAGGGTAISSGIGAPASRMVFSFAYEPPARERAVEIVEAVEVIEAPRVIEAPEVVLAVAEPAAAPFELREVVFFFTDSAELTPQARALLNEVAAQMKAHPELTRLHVEGHTDVTGDADYNVGLSERRARAVDGYLAARGVEGDRTTTRWLGESAPTGRSHDEDRRVEVHGVAEDSTVTDVD